MCIELDIPDFHAHILPLADHGSSSLETSVRQLQLAKLAGVSKIIATPHFYPHYHTVSAFVKKRTAAYKLLSQSLTEDMPEIRLGAEVLLCENLHKIEGLSELCIQGTKTILLELPYYTIDEGHVSAVDSLIKSGYDIILAHADKYNKEDIEKFLSIGAKIQLNSVSLCGLFIPRHLLDWIDYGHVVALGSDIHGTKRRAYKSFFKVKKKFEQRLSYICKQSNSIWDSTTK